VRPAAAAALLAALAAAALLADRLVSVATITGLLLLAALRGSPQRRRVYLAGILFSSAMLFVLSPLLQATGSHPLWSGPIVPVLGPLDVTSEELVIAARNALRLASVGLAFACFALLLDHDRLLAGAGALQRSALAVGLATRLLPTLERDAAGLLDALRGRGVHVRGVRVYASLVSPLLAGSLERGLNLAEAMEARGFGRPGRTRTAPRPWRAVDLAAIAVALAAVALGAVWL
jgi:energy-coupling factor transporter transmembrane protein EcfT